MDRATILKDRQIKKFRLYGFFKNSRFFEPYLLIYLNALGYNLFQIGVFISIRAAFTYLFEVPSAVLADFYGKKNELLVCFGFYIVSFVLLFFGTNFAIVALGMVFYGLGEAFRSGTHKAMILSYLERMGWYDQRGFVYGKTRSTSLLGSSLSAFLSILFVLQLPAMKWIFLLSVVPYLADFLLIASYPDYLNESSGLRPRFKDLWSFGMDQLKSVAKNISLVKIVFSEASYAGIFKSIKDYVQPILSLLVISAGLGSLASFDGEQSLKIYLGIIYGLFYIMSSIVTKNIFRAMDRFKAVNVFNHMYNLMGLLFVLLSVFISRSWLVPTITVYFLLYLALDARRPVFLDVVSDHMRKEQRVTVLSVESQLRAMLMVVMAPLFGFIADTWSLSLLFVGIGISMLLVNLLALGRGKTQ